MINDPDINSLVFHMKNITANMTTARLNIYLADAKTVAFYRNNPVIACEDLLGIYLSDAQAWMLASSWNAEKIVWSCCRNFGKSFIIVIMCLLRAILYSNQNIYIVSSVGNQAKETFTKLEEIVTRSGRTTESIPDIKDIAAGEVVTTAKNPAGFKHDPTSYNVSFHNGSSIYTLNSTPDNARGKRANLIVYDEAAFVELALIVATLPFITQSSTAKYGKEAAANKDTLTRQPPNQVIYASSQDSMDTEFYKRYKEYAKYMLAGDTRYFCCDMPCTCALTMYSKGEEVTPLLEKAMVDAELKANPEKARREYFNKPDLSGGENQIVKWDTIRKNERQIIPYEKCLGNNIILAFDPARTTDNSILSAAEIVHDPDLGICANIIGCTNFINIKSHKKYKLDSNEQLDGIRNILVHYNGDNPDYEYLDTLLIDAGSGGGGVSAYADGLLNNFIANDGKKHKGLIDTTHEIYAGYRGRYPDAINKLRLINPRKYRTQMVEEFIELMELGVIRFPYQYNGKDTIQIIKGVNVTKSVDKATGKVQEDKEEVSEQYFLSPEEKVHLNQIDLMKVEIASIHKSTNAENTSVTYALAKEKQHTMHDDRFYTVILIAHRLYELRRGNAIRQSKAPSPASSYVHFRAPRI